MFLALLPTKCGRVPPHNACCTKLTLNQVLRRTCIFILHANIWPDLRLETNSFNQHHNRKCSENSEENMLADIGILRAKCTCRVGCDLTRSVMSPDLIPSNEGPPQ